MGKKNKKTVKVWCFYCEREFEDEKILIQHQKAKHFKCHVCHKKLSTAGGMVVHVLQVHKESITKVPNAKPERESAELEIFGMEGIPPDVLEARYGDPAAGDDDAARAGKAARMNSSSPAFGAVSSVDSSRHGHPPQPLFPAAMPAAAPPPHMPVWLPPPPPPPGGQPWNSSRGGPQTMLPPPPQSAPHPAQQPLFPIRAPQMSLPPYAEQSSGPARPLFPIKPPPAVLASPPPQQPQQPLFPIEGASGGGPYASNPAISLPRNGLRRGSGEAPADGLLANRASAEDDQHLNHQISPLGRPPVGVGETPVATHMYASAPRTGGPSIGPPPVISNKPPLPLGSVNEVYLVWDDELFSMEERRLFLPHYRVVDETLQMNSIDAAFDRRLLEGRLAGRLGFHV